MDTIILGLLALLGALFGSLLPVAPSAVGLYRSGRKRGYNRRQALAHIVT